MTISPTGKLTGVTLIELMLVAVIITILLSFSIPRFKNSFQELELDNFGKTLYSAINSLSQKSVVEEKVILLSIDNQNKALYAVYSGEDKKLKTYHMPQGFSIDTEQNNISLYPDGSIDKVTLRILAPSNKSITLTTKGVFSGAKVISAE